MASASREPVKVVIINTQYVETDPMNFKSVVQGLTGKDSDIAWIEKSSYVGQKRRRCGGDSGSGGGSGSGLLVMSKDTSFKDLDRLMLELLPMEELQWLWAE